MHPRIMSTFIHDNFLLSTDTAKRLYLQHAAAQPTLDYLNHLTPKEGMGSQINALSNAGWLSRFVGMLTDSRSFMSYPRRKYFRRTLCNLVGKDPDNGLAEPMVTDICFSHAQRYFRLPGVEAANHEA
jgi:glucuronate isomerase